MRFQKGHIPWNKGKHLSKGHRRSLSEALRGEKHPNFGKHRSEEHRRKISQSLKGREFSEEHCRNLSEALRGEKHPMYDKHLSEGHCGNISEALTGRRLSEEHRRNLSEAMKGQIPWNKGIEWHEMQGESNPNWKGGYELYYGPDWYHQRNLARERDDYTCLCGLKENGREHDVHHIVPYRISRDNSQDNLWTLCSLCHRRMEKLTEIEERIADGL